MNAMTKKDSRKYQKTELTLVTSLPLPHYNLVCGRIISTIFLLTKNNKEDLHKYVFSIHRDQTDPERQNISSQTTSGLRISTEIGII